MNITNEEIGLLQQAAGAAQAGQAIYASQAQLNNLVATGLVEVNQANVDTAGNFQFRLTQQGQHYLSTLTQTAPVVASAPAAPVPAPQAAPAAMGATGPVTAPTPAAPSFALPERGFAIGSGFIVPVKKSKGSDAGPRNYDFDKLELGQYQFVPATEKRPDPKKSLASTISSANKRYKAEGKYFKTFRAKKGVEMYGIVPPADGAYIVRVEPPVEETPAAPAAPAA